MQKEYYLNCSTLNLNKQKGVLSLEPNHGNAKNRNIFMDTYVMRKDLFMELVKKGRKISSMFTLNDIVNMACSELDIRGVSHRGFFASITDFKSYYNANLSLIDMKNAVTLLIRAGQFTQEQMIPAQQSITKEQVSRSQ